MKKNSTLMQKADLVVGDLEANGGLMNPEQSDTFIRKLLARPTLLRQARQVMMSSPQMKINKIQFASRILHPAQSQVALTVAQRSKPQTEQITLNSSEVIAEIRLPYDVIEDNIEGGNIGRRTDSDMGGTNGGLKDTIMDLIIERAAIDMEEVFILGDTASADPFLALKDGLLIQSNQNVLNLGGSVTKDAFKQSLQLMPDQYLTDRSSMRHYLSVDNEIEYRDTLADRETALGDGQIVRAGPVFGFGVPVEGVSRMPVGNILLTDPRNMIFGIQRQIHVETDKDITERVYIIVLTARIDVKLEEAEAVVLTEGVTL